MLNRILTLCFLIFFTHSLFAQKTFKPTTHVGVFGGLNYAMASFKPSLKQGLVNAEAYGLMIRHVSEPHIGLQLEVSASGKGWKERIDSVGDYTRKMETIHIPVTAAFIVGSRTLRLAFTIGPYVSYLRDEKEIIKIDNPLEYRKHYGIALKQKWEFGFTGGAGVELHTKIGGFSIRAAYSHSLTNMFSLHDEEYYFSASRNQFLHGGVMYFITF